MEREIMHSMNEKQKLLMKRFRDILKKENIIIDAGDIVVSDGSCSISFEWLVTEDDVTGELVGACGNENPLREYCTFEDEVFEN